MPQSQRGSQRKESSGEKNGSQQEEEARLQVGFQTVNLQIARSLDKPAPDNKGNTTLGTKGISTTVVQSCMSFTSV